MKIASNRNSRASSDFAARAAEVSWIWSAISIVSAASLAVAGAIFGWQSILFLCALLLSPTLFMMKPEYVALGALTPIVFGDTLLKLSGIPQFNLADEASVIVLLVCGMKWAIERVDGPLWPKELTWFSIFLAIGFISSIRADVPFILIAQGTILYAKPFVVGLAFAQIDWDKTSFKIIAKFVGGLTAFILAMAAVNLAAPATWSAILQRSGEVDTRYGLPSLIGPFVHPTYFGAILGLCFLAIMAYRQTVKQTLTNRLLMYGAAVGVLFSFRRRIMVGVAVGALAVVGSKVGKFLAATIGIVLISVTMIASALLSNASSRLGVVGQAAIDLYEEYIVEGATAARTRLTVDSLGVAAENFPFGAGYANFGSYLARVHYSDEYVDLGYREIYGLSDRQGWGAWLTDTQWPAIIGESGYLGAFFYIGGLLVILKRFLRSKAGFEIHERWQKCLLITGSSWFTLAAVDSIASPTFTAPPTFPWIFALAAIVAAFQATDDGKKIKKTSWRIKRKGRSDTQSRKMNTRIAKDLNI